MRASAEDLAHTGYWLSPDGTTLKVRDGDGYIRTVNRQTLTGAG